MDSMACSTYIVAVLNTLPNNQTSKVDVSKDLKRGLHILSNFESDFIDLLTKHNEFKQFIDRQVSELKLSKVGEVYHDFPGGGFTAVVCLAESHLSIHTWPDINYATFDVYLSNHSQDNSEKAKAIYSSVLQHFNAKILYENFINR